MRRDRQEFSIEDFREFFNYDPETGLFTRRKKTNVHLLIGQTITSKCGNGYVRLVLYRRAYCAHRVAWLLSFGCWPSGNIDHINGIRDDNRIANLRDVSHTENMQNIYRPKRGNKSGFRGVSTLDGKWLARIHVNRKNVRLGLFDSPEAASEAYQAAKQLLHIGGDNGRA